MTITSISTWIAIIGATLLAQSEPQGAKALFLDTQTGRMSMPKVSRPSAKPGGATVQLPAITGLMYYLEMVSPSGELVRVNSTRVFHSNEKFRLHVTTNIDGWLTILQSQDGEKFDKLFPAASASVGRGRVSRGVDTVLPGPSEWFKFDDRPGEIRLLMMLTSDSSEPSKTSVTAAEEIRALQQVQSGSKALLIETSDSPREACQVAVVNSVHDPKMPAGQIAIEVRLQHRPRV